MHAVCSFKTSECNAPAQIPHIELLPGSYQGGLALTNGPSTEYFLPEERLRASQVATQMGITEEQLFREYMHIAAMRDLLLPDIAFTCGSQRAGDACLMEGGIVHRGPATICEKRTGRGRLQLFWAVTPTYHVEHYNSNSQTWVGDLILEMAVEAAFLGKDNTNLVKFAIEQIEGYANHTDGNQYPNALNMPWHKLHAHYAEATDQRQQIVKDIAEKVKHVVWPNLV